MSELIVDTNSYNSLRGYLNAKDIYNASNTSYNIEDTKLLNSRPSKSGLNMLRFLEYSLVYHHKKNLKGTNLKYINYLNPNNWGFDTLGTDDDITSSYLELGYVEHYETIIATKVLDRGKLCFRIKPYTAKFGQFISQRTSQIIMRIIKFCIEHQIYYIIEKGENYDITKDMEKVDTEIECAICLETSNNDCVKTKCGHTFHRKCLQKWALQKKECPFCRTNLE